MRDRNKKQLKKEKMKHESDSLCHRLKKWKGTRIK